MTTAKEQHEKLKQAVRELLDKTYPAMSLDEPFASSPGDWDDLTAIRGRLARLSQWTGR